MLSRRRFLIFTTAGAVVAAAGGIALTLRQFSGQGQMLSFQAVTALPHKPLVSYASYVIDGKVNISTGTGTITQYVYAGAPENMTSIALLTRVVHVSSVRRQGNGWLVSGAVENQGQLQKGEPTTFEIQLDSASNVASSTFFGSPIQLSLQRFTTS